MTRLLIIIVGVVLAFIIASIAYHYSKHYGCSLKPLHFAVVAYAITLFLEMIIVVALNQIGLYPD